ncbi:MULTISPECIES: spore coat protein [Aneurinibacillus]|uniref:Coat F domain-containing protein n=1 Tax=Aneurinibacillus thermoaerophilus TaxID=143495 RepID=A0A1G8AW62_ANETH|nr:MULTISPECIES: spore coat protein [Aneurinibacillus]AMA72832.1 hypothetical protein ACH33_08185 [Aneurinibacillus sp. XH2]MED0675219.1 spore coat protein [Aneurinibacillus thermoaerophilus]MED0680085.1 spore coat protein [Aneurinibacillus thermoaerophilus]MED0738157.1 spore coat protein [Aneurinibacillus thermoaerophilus]MED0758225.1 spore coat protein [Aneurinibacillus thermoaerophilus]
MPNNMEGRGLTDREIMQLCLELEKGRARSIASVLLETSHSELRKIYQRCMDTVLDNQKQIFDNMRQSGYYVVPQATPEQIAEMQGLLQNNLNPGSQV